MSTPNIKYARRIPRGQGDIAITVPIAYVEIPTPDPNLAVSLVDVASGTLEDAEDRGINITFTGQTGPVSVGRATAAGDISTLPTASFTIPGPDTSVSPYTSEKALTYPIRVLRVEQDQAQSWIPVVSRGMFYKVFTLTSNEGSSSWLNQVFSEGQVLLLGYTTELDWRLIAGGDRWLGTGVSGGGGLWHVLGPSTYTPTNRQLLLSPSGVSANQGSSRILGLGGIKTSTGVELLAESGSAGVVPGDGTGTLGELTLNSYSASQPTNASATMMTARIQAGTARATGSINASTLAAGTTYSVIESALSESSDANSTVIDMSGSFFVPTEGFYTLKIQAQGKIRLYHWDLPVIDKAYGTPNLDVTRDGLYTAYLHSGWHDINIDWYPETKSGNPTFKFTASPSVTFASNPTTRSEVQEIDVDTGLITLKQNFVAGADTVSPPEILASFGSSSSGLPFRGYFDPYGWHGLDLNPSPGRTYEFGGVESPTNDWVTSSCWIWSIPSIACALTQADGVTPIASSTRTWHSCINHGVNSTLRWGKVSNANTVASGVSSTSPFGATSSFSGGILGQSTYSAQGTTVGIQPTYDPRGDYDSGFILAHLSVSAGLPELSSLRIHDIRVRGGGLSEEIDPSSLPSGGAKERALTYWDMSPWEGDQENTAGKALIEISSSILTGADGGPAWSPSEVESMVENTLAAGIEAIIVYVD